MMKKLLKILTKKQTEENPQNRLFPKLLGPKMMKLTKNRVVYCSINNTMYLRRFHVDLVK